MKMLKKKPNTLHFSLSQASLLSDHNKINITISLGCQDYMVKILDLVNTALDVYNLSLGDGTDQPTCKKQ